MKIVNEKRVNLDLAIRVQFPEMNWLWQYFDINLVKKFLVI